LNNRLDCILGLRLDFLRLILKHVSLDDFKSEYTTFRTERFMQWNRSQVNNAWCKQFNFNLRSIFLNMFRIIIKFI